VKRQFVLDKRTGRFIERLASCRGGNRNLVVREAIRLYFQRENHLDKIEADPAFQAMMRESDRAIREGQVISHEKVLRIVRMRNKQKSK